jgi:hypothetical protein
MPPATRETGPSPTVPNDQTQIYWYTAVESNRQRARVEQRTAVYQSAAVAAGVGVGFIARMLFLRTGRLWAAAPAGRLGAWDWAAQVVPGVVALVCAALLVMAGREERPAPDPKGSPYAVPSYPSFAQ